MAVLLMGTALLSAWGLGPLRQTEGLQAGLFCAGLVLRYLI